MQFRFILAAAFIFSPAQFLFAGNSDSVFIYVHILHGSKPVRHCSCAEDNYKDVGGMFGGHVVLQIDSFNFGFNYFSRHVHPVPKHNHSRRTGILQCDSTACQLKKWSRCKITTIKIPVTASIKKQLLDSALKWNKNPAFDYAFFGMRCASTAYYLLAIAHVFPGASRSKSIRKAFWPGAFRKKILRVARVRNYEVLVKPGTPNRKWEGD